MKFATEQGEEAFVEKTPSLEYWDEASPQSKVDSMREYLQNVRFSASLSYRTKQFAESSVHMSPQFEILPPSRLPKGVEFGISFTILTINALAHMGYLYRHPKEKYGSGS
jgi:D-amino-acid oxidase